MSEQQGAELEALRARVAELEAANTQLNEQLALEQEMVRSLQRSGELAMEKLLAADRNLAALAARHEAIMSAPRARLGRWLAKSMFHRFTPVVGPDWDKSPPRPDLHECHLWRLDSPKKHTTLASGTGPDQESAMAAALDALGEPQ